MLSRRGTSQNKTIRDPYSCGSMHLLADPRSEGPAISLATPLLYHHQQQHTPNDKDCQLHSLFPFHAEHISDFGQRAWFPISETNGVSSVHVFKQIYTIILYQLPSIAGFDRRWPKKCDSYQCTEGVRTQLRTQTLSSP